MFLTRKEALKLHREMWTDMKTELGDNPSEEFRLKFKEDWCRRYFPNEGVCSNCFLCEYVMGEREGDCDICPIVWPNETCYSENYYYDAPISEILELPERRTDADTKI